MSSRREFLAQGAGVGAALLGMAPAQAATPVGRSGLRQAAHDMALYGLPLVEMATARRRAFGNGLRPNTFRHNRRLTDARRQPVTQSNNDTLYSSAWLDLTRGPVRLVLPDSGDRYFSLAILDMFTNNVAVLGTRTTGGRPGEVVVVGPTDSAPAAGAIRAPTPWVWALGRTVAGEAAHLAAAHAIQDQLRAVGPEGAAPASFAPRTAAWPEYLAAVEGLLRESTPPVTDRRLLDSTAELGLLRGAGFDAGRFGAAQREEIARGVQDAWTTARGSPRLAQVRSGWIYPRPHIGVYGQDYAFRAQVALTGLGALPVSEALYLHPRPPGGSEHLDGSRTWKLRFEPGALPPVDGFWSLTVYERTPDGQGFLIDNPIDRYSLGDRSPGLARERDGALEIVVSPKDPGGRTNWLPGSQRGSPISLSLRTYLPRPELIHGQYRLPSLRAV